MDEETSLHIDITAQNSASKALNSALSSLKGIEQNIKNIQGTANGLNNSFKGMKGTVGGLSKGLSSSIISLATIKKTVRGLSQVLNASGEWIENLNLFEVTFGDSSKEVLDWALNISNALGVASSEIVRFTGLFKQMAGAIGIGEEASNLMSQSLSALGYDIASLYNINIENAMEKLRAGIAGQTKPLRELGLDITAQSLDNYLKNRGVDFTSKQLNQADKMLLRSIVIVDQAQKAYGDMARTVNSFSNQVRILSGSWANFKLALGDLVVEPATTAIQFLNGFLIAATNIIRAFVPLQKETGNAAVEMAENIKGVTDASEDLQKSLGLLSFDKFESLTSGNNGLTGVTDLFEQWQQDQQVAYLEQFDQQMATIKSKALDISKAIQEWIFPDITYNEDGTIKALGDVNNALKLMASGLATIVAMKVYGWAETAVIGIMRLVTALKTAENATKAMNIASKALMSTGLFLLVSSVVQLVTNWDEMSDSMKILNIGIATLGTTLLVLGISMRMAGNEALKLGTRFTALWTASKMLTTTGIMALVTGLASYLTLSEKTSPLEKWITLIGSLTAGVIAATVALKAFKVAKMSAFGIGGLVAGIGLTLGSTIIPAFGDGGLPERGGLFIANEKGPELVGNFGNGTAVANNDMIVAAIEEAAYRGVSRAYAENGRSEEIIVPLSINGREFARATYSDFEKEGRRRG